MEHKETQTEKQELETALGPPKYYIDTPGLKNGERYAWFPTRGDSMTDSTSKSIPSGSLVLGRWLKLNSIIDIPLERPIVVIIDDNGTQYCMLKNGYKLKYCPDDDGDESAMICLRSYNPDPRYDDFWIPFSHIKFVFVVEKVRLPDGNEFVPKKVQVLRKEKDQ
jgi:hypothetical protein